MNTAELRAAMERTWRECKREAKSRPDYFLVPFWLLQMVFDVHERPRWERAVSRAWFAWRQVSDDTPLTPRA